MMKSLKLLIIAALLLALAIANPAMATHDNKISGYKWNDQNADGVWDVGEPPLEGWIINLTGVDQWGRPVNMSTTTDVDGYYEFYPENGLWAGNYTVSETLMPGWIQSYPAAPGTHVIVLKYHEHITNQNFGNYQSDIAIELTKTATESYSKAGDVVHYTITVKNTSSEGTPDLECTITDPMLGINQQVTLAWNNPDYVINANYTVLASDPDPLVNTATVTYSPVGSITVFTISDSASVDILHPAFILEKNCAEEPVPFGDDAIFEVTLANTGDVDLVVELDEDVVDTLGGTILAGTQFTLPVGQTLEATVAIPATYPSVNNTINAYITLPEWTGLDNSWNPTASDSCSVITPCSKETAYGLNDALNPVCFNTLGFENWGWTHGPTAYDGVYTFDLWAGAAQCDTDNGRYAGTVTIAYTGSGPQGYTISYDYIEEGFEIVEEQVYIGRDQLPQIKDGKKTIPTVSPGQYYVTKGIHSGDIYIIYHAVVESCE